MAYSSTVTFVAGAYSVTLPAPTSEQATSHRREQVIGLTAAGTRYVYDKAVTRREARIAFSMLTAAQKTALETFYDNVAGGVTTFTYTDMVATAWSTCRFLEPLEFRRTMSARWDVTVVLETASDIT